MEKVNEFKHLETILCKYESINGQVRERYSSEGPAGNRCTEVIKLRSLCMEVKDTQKWHYLMNPAICFRDMNKE